MRILHPDGGIPYARYGDDFQDDALRQMENACRLPVAVAAALMPDAHPGYGLPIGGVLAVDNAVIPYAVGVDIACRMKMTVLDLPVGSLARDLDELREALARETVFGVGGRHARPPDHPVMDEEDWRIAAVTRQVRDMAAGQLGTSGGGNHFVSFGELVLDAPQSLWSRPCSSAPGGASGGSGASVLPAGRYAAILSHSGSRGAGLAVAEHYSRLAMERRRGDLPAAARHLAWLGLDTDEGREYWRAMELMGRYAAAHHELIHARLARRLKTRVLADVENHHNFAWRERIVADGAEREAVVHRKGATPMAEGALGIIPGTMADPGFVVRGRGCASSLASASHGAGRAMSRAQAKRRFTREGMAALLAERGVTLMEAGLDECPRAYKDIRAVMAAQTDLVDVLAEFRPRLVRMAPGHERAED